MLRMFRAAGWGLICLWLAGSPVAAQDPGVYLDDAYTWFSLDSFGHVDDGNRVTDGWSLKSNLRVFGDIPNRSRFKVVVDREHGEPAVYEDDGQLVRTAEGKTVAMRVVGLRNRDAKVLRTGRVPVKVYYIDGRTDEETLLRTYTIDVKSVSKIRGGGIHAAPDYPDYYLDRSGDVVASIIHRRPGRSEGYLWSSNRTVDWNAVEVLLTHAPAIADNASHASHLIAKVNGERLELPQDDIAGEAPTSWSESAEHSFLGDNNVTIKQYYQSRRYQVMLPLTWGAADDPHRREDMVALNDHPGDWEITWVSGTEPLRTWKFRVDENGIVQHPEEAAGDLRLGPPEFFPDATLAETIIPSPGTRLDARLDPRAAQQSYFSGLTWQTAEAKQMAAAIPARDVFADGTTEVAQLEPTAVEPAAPGGGGAAGGEATGVVWDDSYSWLQIKNTTDHKDGQPYAKGWSITGRLRLVGDVAERDSFRLRLLQGTKELANYRTEGRTLRTEDGTFYGIQSAFPNDSPLVKVDGPVTLEVFHVDSKANTERLVKTYNFWVDKVSRQRGSRNNPQPDASHYYIDHHNEVLSSALVKLERRTSTSQLNAVPYGANNAVGIVWHLSPTELWDDLRNDAYVRIRVDGQPLDLDRDAAPTAQEDNEEVVYVTYAKPSERGPANPYTEPVKFMRLSTRLPVTWGEHAEEGLIKLEDHPGKWEVEYRLGRDVIRTWRFTVAPDGSIAPHPEQAHLSLPGNVWFIETSIPDGGSPVDARLVPDRVSRGRFGAPWGSAEGQALAASVPRKGQPAP